MVEENARRRTKFTPASSHHFRSGADSLDLSGTEQGAGGIGGLLFIGNRSSAIGDYAPAYDGNGNVTALLDMTTGQLAAEYEREGADLESRNYLVCGVVGVHGKATSY